MVDHTVATNHNVAVNGAHQNNIASEFSLVKVSVHQDGGSPATIAITQRLGIPLFIRSSSQPLRTLLQSAENTELRPEYFNRRNLYTSRAATFVDPDGSMVHTFMTTHMRGYTDMAPDWMGTMIICLSVFMNRTELADILTRALLVYAHGCVEPRLMSDFGILSSVIDKHAAVVLSHDSMYDKLESTKQYIQENVEKKFPGLEWHGMFTPPRSRSEREDFIELLYRILSAPAEDATIHTRSVKLLGLANLLGHYGWQVDILLQEEHDGPRNIVDIQQGNRGLTIVYSLAESMNDDFIEDHARRGRYMTDNMPGAHFYPTILSKARQWRNGAALYVSTGQLQEKSFLKGYEKVKNAWDKSGRLVTTTLHQGQLLCWFELDSWAFHIESAKHDQFSLMNKLALTRLKRIPLVEAVVEIVSNTHGSLDLERLGAASKEWHEESVAGPAPSNHRLSIVMLIQFLLNSMSSVQDMTRHSIAGGMLAILDSVIESLIRIPADCLVRVPVGASVETLIQSASEYLNMLFDPQHGLKVCDAVLFCAARLAGVNPEDPRVAKTTAREAIIGFWNGQQGILLTPVSERSLLCDLPESHKFALTLHNRPIHGIPTDNGGWIKAGAAKPPFDRQVERFPSVRATRSKVILQYRAHFEVDSTELVAAVYINGVFFSLISVSQALGHFSPPGPVNGCKHSLAEQSAPPPQAKYVSIRSLDTGVRIVPDNTCDSSVIISPHGNRTSRLFAYLLYSDRRPVVQDECFKCAIMEADRKGGIVISRLESESASHPVCK